MRYANALAEELYGVGAGAPRRTVDLLPELDDLSPRSFEARLATSASGEPVLTVRLEALRSALVTSPEAILASVQVLNEPESETGNERAASRRGERLEARGAPCSGAADRSR